MDYQTFHNYNIFACLLFNTFMTRNHCCLDSLAKLSSNSMSQLTWQYCYNQFTFLKWNLMPYSNIFSFCSLLQKCGEEKSSYFLPFGCFLCYKAALAALWPGAGPAAFWDCYVTNNTEGDALCICTCVQTLWTTKVLMHQKLVAFVGMNRRLSCAAGVPNTRREGMWLWNFVLIFFNHFSPGRFYPFPDQAIFLRYCTVVL